MNFILVFKFLLETFKRERADFALIGGFALQAAGITRTTRDIDLLILSENAQKIKDILLRRGYNLIHESEDVLNFSGKKQELGRIDFLLAHRKYTKRMLSRAEEKEAFGGRFKVKVLKAEDLIGLKVQAIANDPGRLNQDMADIKLLIKNNYSTLDMNLLGEYFALFGKEKELASIIKEVKNAK